MSQHDAIAPYADHFSRSVADVVVDLESYASLLLKWQKIQNLVSRETLGSVWSRHFADSLQVLTQLKASDRIFLDIGSGGGLPAIPLAIALKNRAVFTLIEPNSRKVSFLRTVARDLNLPITVKAVRSDQVDPAGIVTPDVVTSRALAALPQLCTWMAPFFSQQTRAILHKGREYVEELQQTVPFWSYDVIITPSTTDSSGVLLTLRNLRERTSS